jgi:Skp family chaperone for outer membrane proteins
MKKTYNKMDNQIARLMRRSKIAGLLFGFPIVALNQAVAQALPLEIKQDKTLYNYQSGAGVPTSGTVGNPVGSNGKAPTSAVQGASSMTTDPPTANQFSGFISWGAVARPASTSSLDDSRTYSGNAPLIDLPRGPKDSDTPTIVLLRAQVGAPFLNRPVSFLFGGIISPPNEDEAGTKLDSSVSPDTYWFGEPHLLTAETAAGHTAKGYYYSPHARAIFAIQPGPIEIIWRKATPATTTPTDSGDATKWYESVGNYYQLYKKRYVVSGSAAKTPRKIYWNQAGYQGPQVTIPASSVGELKIVYNSSFLERVPKEKGIPAQETGAESSGGGIDLSLPDGTSVVVPGGGDTVYTKTLWHQGDSLMALNAEGRVFVELLGDLREDGATRYHLGYEIVDVFKTSTPADVTIELGDRVTAWNPAEQKDDSHLIPQPNLKITGEDFVFQAGGANVVYYAARETRNLNDYNIQWMEKGLEGILWPSRHSRYKFVWPDNPARYSHYIRPQVPTKQTASLTAVPMPNDNTPTIQYQDPLDGDRAFFTNNFGFYTFLDADYPVHRTLLRFTSGTDYHFERVFSWLDTNVKEGTTLGNSALGLKTWLPSRDLKIWGNADSSVTGSVYDAAAVDANGDAAPVNQLDSGFLTSAQLNAPRHLSEVVNVGGRITAPTGELGSGDDDYWAGYIQTDPADINRLNGKVIPYNPNAYIDPIANGFEASNLGAIIPVNADPSNNVMEVYWYRKNGADVAKGFQSIYWPSVLGRYTIQWPTSPSEIVLASNDGSGALPSLQAKGSIYVQNDSTLAGYNPNEEHALILADQAYALRDDLNDYDTGTTGYSSDPYVLVEYTESDSRLAMKAFKVLREKPGSGILFDYITEAGQMLQAPMPLPLLAKPVDGTGSDRTNYNSEPAAIGGDEPTGWDSASSALKATYGNYQSFTYEDRKGNHWVYRGLHAGAPTLEAGTYDGTSFVGAPTGTPAAATAKVGEAFSYTVHASRRAATLTMAVSADSTNPKPDWLSINSLTLSGIPAGSDTGSLNLDLVLTPSDGSDAVTVTLAITVSATASAVGQAAMNLNYTESSVTKIVGNRPPALAEVPTAANSFVMKFYYRTLEGFYWPGMSEQPAVDTIVPYLRPLDGSGGYSGDASSKETASLEIVYRPVWPANTKVLGLSETLTEAKNGLPAVRGQSSLRVLYQQSIATAFTSGEGAASVILHDPTREKSYALGQSGGLAAIPASVKTYAYQGKTYFPNLPPHLSQRLFYDPNRGSDGELVFKGSYVDEVVGEDYLLLNVLDGAELALVKGLCVSTDTDKTAWDTAIDGLATSVETFYEPTSKPGQWLPNMGTTAVTGVSGDSASAPGSVAIGALAAITHDDKAVDSYALSASGPGTGYVTLITNDGNDPSKSGLPITVYIIRVGQPMYRGEVKVLYSSNPLDEKVTFQHTADLGGKFGDFDYEWKIQPPVDGADPKIYYAQNDSAYDASNPKKLASGWTPLDGGSGLGINRYTLGGSGIQTLSDNYIIMRYRPNLATHPGYVDLSASGLTDAEKEAAWSEWTVPQLAEGWIKRVLAGINPFNQRSGDMFSNSVNTEGSMLTQAGGRWEGDIALNLESINDHGLIGIYETVLNRGKSLSIESGINYGPANDALLLAAGYLNDLYMMVGNEAYADAANPTIGIGTKDKTYGDIATALFSFKGQMASLLEEELGLLRGRDDFMQPGVETGPVYNKMFWNYTRGIDSGEVIYALNYNIQEDQGENLDGSINAADAARMYPQGHGDAYGHYLTALKGYYKLVADADFSWAPRTEAVTVLGKPVQVDYMDERKFAAAAAALARTGQQVLELTWRRDYQPGDDSGWAHFEQTRTNERRSHAEADTTVQSTRRWGMDHWAARTGIGSMVNWVVGNAMLPEEDTDPSHEGIQKIDRTTVPELQELAAVAFTLQTTLDNAEAGMNPLGLSEDAIAFDIDPDDVGSETHYEQIYDRAQKALGNAVASFDDAKGVTGMMRSEEDEINEFQAEVAQQELAYKHELIELYGTPYADDIGVGKTYKQGYDGPDLLHHVYVDSAELSGSAAHKIMNPTETATFELDIQNVPSDWNGNGKTDLSDSSSWTGVVSSLDGSRDSRIEGTHKITYKLDSHGFFSKPSDWKGRRESPGQLQEAVSQIIIARNAAFVALDDATWAKYTFDRQLSLYASQLTLHQSVVTNLVDIADRNRDTNKTIEAIEIGIQVSELLKELADDTYDLLDGGTPDEVIFGFSNGGNFMKVVKLLFGTGRMVTKGVLNAGITAMSSVAAGEANKNEDEVARIELENIIPVEWSQDRKEAVLDLESEFNDLRGNFNVINERLQQLQDARQNYAALVASGNRIQKEREIFRQRASAVVQGFRTRDAAFRIFRNEKLERYKTLFDLSARYTYLAAKAYDYETGLLHTDQGKSFLSRIVQSRSLGVIKDGAPQYAGSNTGDPGLSSVMAEMNTDWSVLEGRLGFNNPDTYGTTVSMRSEKFRILPGADGSDSWRDTLELAKKRNLLSDPDVRRHCMQIDGGDGLPVPGIVLEFSTVIKDGLNLFGKPLAPADSYFSTSSFANKIHSVGIAFHGYKGMADPNTNTSGVGGAGGGSPTTPGGGFLDPQGLSATPYVYLIPVGVDSMRSPPLGDVSVVRTWTVQDVAVPLPFNIGASEFSTKKLWQSADSLSEELFSVRKHQAFRAVSTADIFVGDTDFNLANFTNNRLIGRSVWNSKWKLVIPGKGLLNDPNEGLDRFIQTVKDIKIHLQTYSYSGN